VKELPSRLHRRFALSSNPEKLQPDFLRSDPRNARLVYSESFDNAAAALKRERQIKRWTRAKKAALVAGDRDLLKKLSPTPRH
jgi:predicted GIY-YIG superfamily endonuclease